MIEFNPDAIIQARKKLGLEQYQLADKAGISRATLIKAEKGRSVNINTFLKILNALGTNDPGRFFTVPILFRRFSSVNQK